MDTKDTTLENGMHDKCKNVIIFHNNFCKYLKNLKGVLPEYGPTIKECIAYYKSVTRGEYLKEVQELMQPHIRMISEYDEGLFTDDYREGPMYLLPKMNFRDLWELLDTSEDFVNDPKLQSSTKKSIFNHLQSIYISVQMAIDQIDIFNRNIEKQKTFLMEMLENLQLDDKIKQRIEEMKSEEAEANGEDGFSLDKLASMFGEDNFVYQLAKDVADELDFGTDDISNPVDAITSLFANNGKKLQELIVTVGDKIEEKVQSGEIDKDKLVADAQLMKDKLEGVIGKIPQLEEMMNNDALMNEFRTHYRELAEDEKNHFKDIPSIMDKPLLEWDEQEKELFNEFAQYVMEKQQPPEQDLPDDESAGANSAQVPKKSSNARIKKRRKKAKRN